MSASPIEVFLTPIKPDYIIQGGFINAILTQDATEWGKPIIRQHAILKFSLFQKEMPIYKELSVICNIDPPNFDSIKQRYGWGKSTSLATCGGDLIYWLSSSCREKLI